MLSISCIIIAMKQSACLTVSDKLPNWGGAPGFRSRATLQLRCTSPRINGDYTGYCGLFVPRKSGLQMYKLTTRVTDQVSSFSLSLVRRSLLRVALRTRGDNNFAKVSTADAWNELIRLKEGRPATSRGYGNGLERVGVHYCFGELRLGRRW